MTADQTTPDHIGDANKMVTTMPERISFFASRVATTLFEAGHIDQRNHAKVSKVVALMVNDELNQSLLAQSVLMEAFAYVREYLYYPDDSVAEYIERLISNTIEQSTITPPTDRIVVTREMVEKLPCVFKDETCLDLKTHLLCPRCQLLATKFG